MAKFVLVYSGGMGMEMEPEARQQVMDDWGAWYGQMGEAIVDGGAPFGPAKNITSAGIADGTVGAPAATGYTIIEADSLDAAADACANHPHVKHGGAVDVYTWIDMQSAEM